MFECQKVLIGGYIYIGLHTVGRNSVFSYLDTFGRLHTIYQPCFSPVSFHGKTWFSLVQTPLTFQWPFSEIIPTFLKCLSASRASPGVRCHENFFASSLTEKLDCSSLASLFPQSQKCKPFYNKVVECIFTKILTIILQLINILVKQELGLSCWSKIPLDRQQSAKYCPHLSFGWPGLTTISS
jgi:hypothetical protein